MSAQQLQNLRDLLVIGERILDKQLPFHFGEWQFDTPCGTFGCLLGQYGVSKGVKVGNFMSATYRKDIPAPISYAMDEFGMTKPYAIAFFRSGKQAKHPEADSLGAGAYIELERRLGHLRIMIGEREAAEKPIITVDGIPESVRAIFETGVAA